MSRMQGRPLIFGEVLFDRFADGSAVLGGAPFNVAWHLHGFGLRPIFISRIGADALGGQVLDAMRGWGMDSRGLESDPKHPTGTVRVELTAGQPSFDIVAGQAYDFIDADEILERIDVGACSLLYHGTLALRSATSRQSLVSLGQATSLPTFVDLNLRPPWCERAQAEAALRGARWVKLNEHELAEVLDRPSLAASAIETAARELHARYPLELLVVTLGGEGACILSADAMRCGAPVVVRDLVDTVGAGDAFSAATILGLSLGWPIDRLLARALEFAAAICRQRGATRDERGLYQDYLRQWGE